MLDTDTKRRSELITRFEKKIQATLARVWDAPLEKPVLP